MKKLLTLLFSFFYFVAKSEVTTASFFLVHEPKIPLLLRNRNKSEIK
ncbi:cyclic lactone autoinducer peptide [Solibacillus sp. FSL K6-1126]